MCELETIRSLTLRFARLALLGAILLVPAISFAQRDINRGGDGNPAPTPTPTPPPNPLPQLPPSADIIYRESFGEGPYVQRPSGGKGTMKSSFVWEKLGGFWIEYPGSKNTQWLNLAGEQGWRFCSMGESSNPYEPFSPLQVRYTGEPINGCVASGFDEATGISPTALVPFNAPTVPYEVSIDGLPSTFQSTYIAVGLTNSSVLNNNLENSSAISLALYPEPFMLNLVYELKAGSTVIASGVTEDWTFNRLHIRIDPQANTVGGSVNGADIGTFPLAIGRPRYAGFEGIGMVDNFIIRKTD